MYADSLELIKNQECLSKFLYFVWHGTRIDFQGLEVKMSVSWFIVGFVLLSSVPQNRSFKLPPVPSFRKPVISNLGVANVSDVELISNDPNKIRFLLY